MAVKKADKGEGATTAPSPLRKYYVGLTEDAPYDFLDIPAIRGPEGRPGDGISVTFSKRTSKLDDNGKMELVQSSPQMGGFQTLTEAEVKGVLKEIANRVIHWENKAEKRGHEKKVNRNAKLEEMTPREVREGAKGSADEPLARFLWIIDMEDPDSLPEGVNFGAIMTRTAQPPTIEEMYFNNKDK
jgi:hypothetical protein